MKAVRYHKFGEPEVLTVEEIDNLEIADNQLLVEVYSTSVNSGDCHLRSGTPFLARVFAGPIMPREKILGTTYSGKIIQAGLSISKFKVGDEVMGSLGIKSGTYAQFIAIEKDSTIIKKPPGLTHEEAVSLIFGSLSAKFFLDKAGIAKKKSILIIGASGGVGSYAVQYARNMQTYVTGVCHRNNVDFVAGLGANKIIDYTADQLKNYDNQYDIIFDTVGKESLSIIESCLKKEGTYITTVARPDVMLRQFLNRNGRKHFMFDVVKSEASSLACILDFVSKGSYVPLIDSVYKMGEVVAAHRRAEEKNKTGAIVLNIKE